jgi:hypothetical protein
VDTRKIRVVEAYIGIILVIIFSMILLYINMVQFQFGCYLCGYPSWFVVIYDWIVVYFIMCIIGALLFLDGYVWLVRNERT